MKKTMTIPALLLAMAPYAFAQETKVPDAVAALEALESAAQTASKNADVTWNTGAYSYDEAGNITAIGPQYFVYDTVGRLIKARVARDFAGADMVTQTFRYDIYGNLLQTAKDGGAPQSIAVSAASNRLSALGTSYDEAGNQTGWSVGGTISYVMSYDAFGMPATLDASNAPIRAFVYTADDERLFTYDHSSLPESHWTLRDLDGSVLRDYHLAGTTWTVSRDYYYRDGLMLASSNATTELHYSLDHLGTPRVLTNASRQQIAFQSFLPFGEEITPAPLNDGAVKKFTGHERDSDPAGIAEPLDSMHARFYNGRVGRFLSVDPVLDVKRALQSPQMWNRYTYAADNPMVYTDPTGTTVYLVTYTTGNRHGDDEFKRAAETRAAEIQKQKGYDSKKDTVLLVGVRTKEDFAAAVKQANGLESQFGKVGNISLFSHSGPRDGPIFHDPGGHMTQFTSSEVGSLSVNWADNASASFYGCNTALMFAGMFTRQQGVATDGFSWYSSFSSNPDHYERIKPTGPVYMMSVAPRQLRSLGVKTPLPMTHYTAWPWDGQ